MSAVVPLDEFDPAPPAAYVPYDRERFRITDDGAAEWAIRKLHTLRSKMEENRRIAEAERQRIESWLEHANEALTDDAHYFEGILGEYALTQRVEADRKSITLPHGTVKTRASRRRYDVADAESFLAWARDNAPHLIRVTEAPKKSEFGEVLDVREGHVIDTQTGEIVPGVAASDEPPSVTIDTK